MLDAFSVLFGLCVGAAVTISFICVCIPTPRGYQPKRPSKADIEKANEFLAHAKPKKSGVPPLVKVVKLI